MYPFTATHRGRQHTRRLWFAIVPPLQLIHIPPGFSDFTFLGKVLVRIAIGCPVGCRVTDYLRRVSVVQLVSVIIRRILVLVC